MADTTLALTYQQKVLYEPFNCHLWTMETIYRILHVLTLRMDHKALWVFDIKPDPAFLVQLKLVLAIRATTYHVRFSLRGSAVR
jgi:hypothetical protein